MVRTLRLSLVAVLLSPLQLLAQQPVLPAQPVPVAPQPPPGSVPPIIVPRTELPPNNNPIVPQTPVFVDQGNPYQPVVQPERRPAPCSGFYGMLEIALVFPELRGWLSGTVNQGSFVDTLSISSAGLDASGSPRLELGYRLGDGLGAVAVTYKSIVATGGFNIDNFDVFGPGYLNTRLNLNVVDIDYASNAFNILPFWDIAFRAGVRGAAVYFDHQATGQFAQLQASSNFLGAGPHAAIELGRQLDLCPGWAVTTKFDGAVLFGTVSQNFGETFHYPDQDYGSSARYNSTNTVPVFTFNLGFTYTPPGALNWARFGFGYQFEYWWDLGTRGDSRTDLSGNGFYFRGEFNF